MTSPNILSPGHPILVRISARRNDAKSRSGSEFLVSLSRFLLIALVCALQACVSSAPHQPTTPPPAEVEERVVFEDDALPLPEDRDIRVQPLPGAPAESSVVTRLMASASTSLREGDTDSAVSSLERAMRIEPRNATLWNRLAEVRFSQQNWQQAIQLASRSNTLAGDNPGLRRQNWNLIASAHTALGNLEEAEKYRSKLRQP